MSDRETPPTEIVNPAPAETAATEPATPKAPPTETVRVAIGPNPDGGLHQAIVTHHEGGQLPPDIAAAHAEASATAHAARTVHEG